MHSPYPSFFTLFIFIISIRLLHAQPNVIAIVGAGESQFQIYASPAKGDSDPGAAAEILRKYVLKTTGVDLTILPALKGESLILILAGDEARNYDPAIPLDQLGEDGFCIKQKDNNLIIAGNNGRACANGVYTFLEQFADCRYYSPDVIVTPHLHDIFVPVKYNKVDIPAFAFRLNYYGEAFDKGYAEWHKLHNNPGQNNLKTKNNWGMWVHTIETLVPPSVYFDKHPEYYAQRNGQRVKDQLCLSNPAVLEIVKDSLRAQISRNPGAKYWSVSQMDNYNYCECDLCRKIDEPEGSPSASVIRFVNQVAAAFPDRVISTLAYQFSRKPPKTIRPADNVNIMLCTIECDRSKPIASEMGEGSFYRDLEGWSKIAKDILVWDYVINFSNIDMPFPNLEVLGPNLQLFHKFGVKSVFEQGWASYGGENEPMRAYLISKLLWNPDEDLESLKEDFRIGYYKGAAPYIREYMNGMSGMMKSSGKPLLIYEHPFAHRDDYLSPNAMIFYNYMFDRAKEFVIGDTAVERRVEMARQPIRYAMLENAKALVLGPGGIYRGKSGGGVTADPFYPALLDTFVRLCEAYGPPVLHETSIKPAEYRAYFEKYAKEAYVSHLAINKTVTLQNAYAPKYAANGAWTLTDGIRGSDKWEVQWQGFEGVDVVATIDLGEEKPLRYFQTAFMDDNQAWILAPLSVSFEVSSDGVHFKPAGKSDNKEGGKNISKQIKSFEVSLSTAVKARYVRMTAVNNGEVPAWRGVHGKAWLFVDEIVVK